MPWYRCTSISPTCPSRKGCRKSSYLLPTPSIPRPQLESIEREGPTIDCSSDCPWIAILVDYGLDRSEVEAKLTTDGRRSATTTDGLVISVCEYMQQGRVAILSNFWIKNSAEGYENSSTLISPFRKGVLWNYTYKTECNSGALRK